MSNASKTRDAYRIRDAIADDLPALNALIPQLADFELPPGRRPDDLWQGDAKLMAEHLAGNNDNTFLLVAESECDGVVGLALTSMQPEWISHAPSAHLEAIVVAPEARGSGLGRRLLAATERRSAERGALTLTLHAFRSNTRARGVYEKAGYDAELYRYTKSL